MKARVTLVLAALASLLATSASAQSRGEGWEFGANLIYQDSQDLTFEGGSTASLEDDIGLAITFAYRFNDRLELEFGVDWTSIDYDVNVVAAPPSLAGFGFRASGELESFTPHANLNFNFVEGPLTPYITAGIGWSFVDTNIPNAPPQTACYWDPWFGYICGTYQETRTFDDLTYQAGVGLRWDVSPGYSMRLGYEKHWLDVSSANGTPEFDQLKLGVTFRY